MSKMNPVNQGNYNVILWLEVLEKEKMGFPADLDQLRCMLDHSSLIHWINEGNEPLPEPPPIRFSRPDHNAVVDKKFTPLEVWVLGGEGPEPKLIVDQSRWKIIETLGEQEWKASPAINRKDKEHSDSIWHFRSTGPSEDFANSKGSLRFVWEAVLISEGNSSQVQETPSDA